MKCYLRSVKVNIILKITDFTSTVYIFLSVQWKQMLFNSFKKFLESKKTCMGAQVLSIIEQIEMVMICGSLMLHAAESCNLRS